MKWTNENERKFLELWAESERRTAGKMVTKTKQHRWMFDKMVQWLTERGESVDPKEFTVRSIKNKVDNLRRKGKDLIHKHIKPIMNEEKNKRKQGTGSAADETAATPSDPMEAIDWEELEKITKWPNFQLFWSLFGQHPSWGIWPVGETGEVEIQQINLESNPTTPTTPATGRQEGEDVRERQKDEDTCTAREAENETISGSGDGRIRTCWRERRASTKGACSSDGRR